MPSLGVACAHVAVSPLLPWPFQVFHKAMSTAWALPRKACSPGMQPHQLGDWSELQVVLLIGMMYLHMLALALVNPWSLSHKGTERALPTLQSESPVFFIILVLVLSMPKSPCALATGSARPLALSGLRDFKILRTISPGLYKWVEGRSTTISKTTSPTSTWVHDTDFVRGPVPLRAAHSSTPRLVLKSKN